VSVPADGTFDFREKRKRLTDETPLKRLSQTAFKRGPSTLAADRFARHPESG
jgi:hypothetical protein